MKASWQQHIPWSVYPCRGHGGSICGLGARKTSVGTAVLQPQGQQEPVPEGCEGLCAVRMAEARGLRAPHEMVAGSDKPVM